MPQTDDQTFWTIGQMAKTYDVTARALRFYEDKGLLEPRRDGQNRHYGSRERARLTLILRGKKVGLSLLEIRELIDLYDVDKDHRVQMQKTLERFQEQAVFLRDQKIALEEAIVTLDERINWLKEELAKPAPPVQGAHAYDAIARASLDGLVMAGDRDAKSQNREAKHEL